MGHTMAAIDHINRAFREFRRYTGDGLPGAPANAPLPVGDPQSGPNSPKKSEIRGALIEAVNEAVADAAPITLKTWAELAAVAGVKTGQPAEVVNDGGTHTDPVVGGTVANAGVYSWSTSPAGWRRVSDTGIANVQSRVAKLGAGQSIINALSRPAVLTRFFPHTEAVPSQFMRKYMGIKGINQTYQSRLLLKRNSVSANSSDVGQYSQGWEPDVVELFTDCAVININSTSSSGSAWTTDNAVLPGVYTRKATEPGYGRIASFTGDFFRLQYVELAGTAPIDLYVDEQFLERIPAGSGTARRVVITRAGFGPGTHTLRYTHAGTSGQPIYVSGTDVADADALYPGAVGGSGASEIAVPGKSFAGAGVHTLVLTQAGGLRMGGGHGGVRRLAKPIHLMDGIERDPDLVTTTEWRASERDELIESLAYDYPVDVANPTGAKFVFAYVTRKMTFRFGGYDCEMDIAFTNGATGRTLQDFYYSQLPMPANMTEIKIPELLPVTGAPYSFPTRIVVVRDPISGLETELIHSIEYNSPDDVVSEYYLFLNSGQYKIYGQAVQNGSPKTFVRNAKIKYSMNFRMTNG